MTWQAVNSALSALRDELDKDDKEFQLALYKIKVSREENLRNKEREQNEVRDLKKSVKKEIDQLNLILESREENFRKLYNVEEIYQTSKANETLEKFENANEYTLDNLYNNLSILEAKDKEIKEQVLNYKKQGEEFDQFLYQDKDWTVTPAEFTNFLNQKIGDLTEPGEDGKLGTADDVIPNARDVAGYKAAFKNYFGSPEMIKMSELSQTVQRRDKGELSRSFDTYLRHSKDDTLSDIISKGQSLKTLKESDNFPFHWTFGEQGVRQYENNKNTEEAIVWKAAYDLNTEIMTAKSRIGAQYAFLQGEKMPNPKEDPKKYHALAVKFYQEYIGMHQKARTERDQYQRPIGGDPDYSYFFDSVKDAYNNYKGMDQDQRLKFDRYAGKFYGYNPAMMSFKSFAEQMMSEYSIYSNSDFIKLGVVLDTTKQDDEGIKDDDETFKELMK